MTSAPTVRACVRRPDDGRVSADGDASDKRQTDSMRVSGRAKIAHDFCDFVNLYKGLLYVGVLMMYSRSSGLCENVSAEPHFGGEIVKFGTPPPIDSAGLAAAACRAAHSTPRRWAAPRSPLLIGGRPPVT